MAVEQRYFAGEVRVDRRLDILSWVVNLHTFQRLAQLQGPAEHAKELDLHRNRVSVLTQLVRFLSEASRLEHDVASSLRLVEFERDLNACIELEVCHWFVGSERTWVLQS